MLRPRGADSFPRVLCIAMMLVLPLRFAQSSPPSAANSPNFSGGIPGVVSVVLSTVHAGAVVFCEQEPFRRTLGGIADPRGVACVDLFFFFSFFFITLRAF